jgi:hypothetical protein
MLCRLRNRAHHDLRRRTRQHPGVVMLSQPVTCIAQPLPQLRQLNGILQCLSTASASINRRQIKNGKWNAHLSYPSLEHVVSMRLFTSNNTAQPFNHSRAKKTTAGIFSGRVFFRSHQLPTESVPNPHHDRLLAEAARISGARGRRPPGIEHALKSRAVYQPLLKCSATLVIMWRVSSPRNQ